MSPILFVMLVELSYMFIYYVEARCVLLKLASIETGHRFTVLFVCGI